MKTPKASGALRWAPDPRLDMLTSLARLRSAMSARLGGPELGPPLDQILDPLLRLQLNYYVFHHRRKKVKIGPWVLGLFGKSGGFHGWNLADFMMKYGRFHGSEIQWISWQWNPVDFMDEIWQISWWNLADFMSDLEKCKFQNIKFLKHL